MTIIEKDKHYIWHPLTQHKTSLPIKPIIKANGIYLFDNEGNRYIDAISSWYTAVYGHCNAYIQESLKKQLSKLDHIVFSGFTHEPAANLAEKLIKLLPQGQQKVFFNDNGSTATEVGIKIALQYNHNKQTKRRTIVAFEEAFHGDTFGAMSVSDLSVYNGAFKDYLITVERIPVPNGENNEIVLSQLKKINEKENIACFIYEPLVQGAAAMRMYDRQGLDNLLAYCKKNDILLIADEVMTGFGKTGKNFASDYLTIKPDIICLSKALTAGVLPMGATTCTQSVFEAFYAEEQEKGFFHGHTYTATPLACAVAIAGIEILQSDEIQNNIKNIEKKHKEFIQTFKNHPKVKNIRSLGVILAMDLDIKMSRYGNLRNRLYEFFMQKGIYLRPLGNTVYIVPPYIIKMSELEEVYAAMKDCLTEF